MINIMLNIFGFLILLFFILLLACACLTLLALITSYVGKIYSEISGKENWLSKLYDNFP